MTNDYPLDLHGPEPLADFWTATEQHRAGQITRDDLRKAWTANGWGKCIPAGLAREMVDG
ncbi:hypothetical protein J2792_002357 [Novosphingobium capsulatum]|uniref:Uncharacterized protein n=1 Tax=Novosphingobium capsulatum TaxID=13688 RepID=A0ABU1MMB8_9SPHN|nr:hypothetical protein [Novosphingobium capsulatum]MDR6511485.1 hypothetical protein [Novosphingobium capsulatum]